MIEPTGYTALDLVGFTDRGTYAANVNYVKNDLVHHGGNIWRILIDDTIGITPAEGPNYTLFMGEPINLVERIIAPLEDNPATVAYQTGRQIIYNDHLYEVIQNIAIGDVLIAYEDDPTNANIKLASPVETQVLALNATKVNKNDVVNNVTTTTAGKVLDARQGKALQDGINTKVNKSDIANNVTTTAEGKVLDARQGKILQDGINTKINKSDIANNVTTTIEGKVLDARQGKTLQDGINTKVNKSDIANNVTTTTAGKVLDARQGKALQDGKTNNSVIAPVESGTTASRAYAKGAHFIKNGAFCTSKTAIAQGETFTLNTNYTAGTVGNSIKELEESPQMSIVKNIINAVDRSSSITDVTSNIIFMPKLKIGIVTISFRATSGIGSSGACLGNWESEYIPTSSRPIVPMIDNNNGKVDGSLYANNDPNANTKLMIYAITSATVHYVQFPIFL